MQGPRSGGSGGMDAAGPLKQLIFGFMPSRLIHTAAWLGLPDQVADGARTTAELAGAVGADPAALRRLLQALTCFGVLIETEPDTFALGPMGGPLRSDAPDSLRSLAMHIGGEALWQSWGGIEESVRTGGGAFERQYGTDYFSYLDRNPRPAEIFNAAMGALTGDVTKRIVAEYDFSRFRSVVDVGGGSGTLIAAILSAEPALRGTLFDTEQGAGRAAPTLADAGVADRCTVRTGDFFTSVPEDGDLYVLKSVLHDWDDERSVRILKTCAQAMGPGDTILVVEPSQSAEGDSGYDANAVLSDLNMMVLTGGRERSPEDIGELFRTAGLELTGVTSVSAGTRHSIAEGAVRA
ncbi:methyltransferase [Nocardiopsis coralliicola]